MRALRQFLVGASTVAVVMVVSTLAEAPRQGGSLASARAEQDFGSDVTDAQLVSSSSGWALTLTGLRWTDDNGATWQDITPAGVSAGDIAAVFFLDPSRGWVVGPSALDPEGSQQLTVFATQDGGRSWVPYVPASLDASLNTTPIHIDFADELNGWIMLTRVTSSNFSQGDLYRTTDGGLTWTKVQIPIGGDIEFVTPTDGWTAGGAAGNELFVTRDGGEQWTAVSVPRPPAFKNADVVYGVPTFFNAQEGVVPVTFTGNAQNSGFAFFQTQDGGSTWAAPGPVVPRRQATDFGVSMLADPVTKTTWFEADPSGSAVNVARNRGKTQQSLEPQGLPPGLFRLDFASESTGWAVAAVTVCHEKVDCSYDSELVQTKNAGQGWGRLAVP
jgi:photosystem II stability/assembly factor-like uncharacterized protein